MHKPQQEAETSSAPLIHTRARPQHDLHRAISQSQLKPFLCQSDSDDHDENAVEAVIASRFSAVAPKWLPSACRASVGESGALGEQRYVDTEVHANGERYVGEFLRGVIDGLGSYTWPDGRRYEGQWADGLAHGEGSYRSADGKIYIGGFVAGKMHGQGCMEWPSGRKFEGLWEENLQSGRGKLWLNDKEYREAIFNAGRLERWVGPLTTATEMVCPPGNSYPAKGGGNVLPTAGMS